MHLGGGRSVQPEPERKNGHSALRFNRGTKQIEKFDPRPEDDANLLDALWNALPEAQKKDALRAAIDSIL